MFKHISIFSSGGHFVQLGSFYTHKKTLVQLSITICAILVEGIMRNLSVKVFRILASGSGINIVYKKDCT